MTFLIFKFGSVDRLANVFRHILKIEGNT